MSCSSAARRAVSTEAPSSLGHQRRQVRALDQVVEHVLAVAGPEAKLAEQPQQLGVEAGDPRLERRPLALLDDPRVDLVARRARRSPRSAPGGCARRRSAARASRGRSRGGRRRSSRARPPTGVSSMITSTPVSFSSARMLRPSRPMIRPFISSLGSSTRRVVDSLECLAASRCMATERMLRARRSASTRVSSSICCRRRPAWWRASCSTSAISSCFACAALRPGEPLELAALHALRLLQLLGLLDQVALAVLERLQRAARGRRAGPPATRSRAAPAPPSGRSPRGARAARRSAPAPLAPAAARAPARLGRSRRVAGARRAARVARARVEPSLPLRGPAAGPLVVPLSGGPSGSAATGGPKARS